MIALLTSRTASAVRLEARRPPVLAAALAAMLAAVLSATALVTHLLTPLADRSAALRTPEATLGPALALTGALLLARAAARRLPLLLLVIGVASSTYACAAALSGATQGRGAIGTAAAWLAAWTWAAGFPPLASLLPLLFPDGRPPSARWRPVVAAATALIGGLCVLAAVAPGPVAGLDAVTNPLGVSALAGTRGAVQGVFTLMMLALAACGLASLVVRWRRADPVERRQVAWFGYGLAVVVVASFLTSGWVLHLASLALPAAVAVAVVRYRLYDIDRLLDRTAVGAVLLAGAALIYAAVVGWAGAVLGERGALPGFVGAAAVALAFAPARARVQRAVDRMLHGRRGDPYALLTDLAASLQSPRTPREALRDAVQGVAEGLRLPAVVVTVVLPDGGTVVEQTGDPSLPAALQADLRWHGEVLGTLGAAARPGTDDLDPLDRRLLADLAGQVAAVAYALRLSQDLERSRNALVTAVAEERRRLRRDLHDGLGPQLAGVALGLSSAERALSRGDDARARDLLVVARGQLEGGVADVRRLVHGLRPPALDDLGLLEALRTTGPAAGGLLVQVAAPHGLPPLPAAVEVAAYRIAQEALTNVSKHAGVPSARVLLRGEAGVLEVEVLDEGSGVPAQRTPGVGLQSMRERAEELGGTCEVRPREDGGTRVLARLPLLPGQRMPS